MDCTQKLAEVWPTREAFIEWCRKNGVVATADNNEHCIMSNAIKKLMNVTQVDTGYTRVNGDVIGTMPSWSNEVVLDFMDGKLPDDLYGFPREPK